MAEHEMIRVLLADDDKDDRTDFIEAFETLKIKTTVKTVNDGVELMEYLKDPLVVLPHLLFLDLNMPRKSGLECLHEIRKNKKLRNITIVIYSTSSSAKDIEETFLKGANVYLKKPAHLTVLRKSLLHVLTVNWQYHTSGLNRENFLLQI